MIINGNAPCLRAWGVFYGLFAPFGAENVIFSTFLAPKSEVTVLLSLKKLQLVKQIFVNLGE